MAELKGNKARRVIGLVGLLIAASLIVVAALVLAGPAIGNVFS